MPRFASETAAHWAVGVVRRDGTTGLALGNFGYRWALFAKRKEAAKFAEELRLHIPSCKVKVVKVRVTVEPVQPKEQPPA